MHLDRANFGDWQPAGAAVAFFSENRRRNMLKASTVYLFGIGTTLKLLDMMLQGLDLPNWIMRTVAVVLFAGLPMVVYRAWRRGEDPGDSHESDAQQRQRKGPPPERSIAVLPFVNMSSDEEQEFFSDGLSEELLNLLAKIPELQVASRTSAFSFKGESVDIPTVAQRLNVGHVLEGSVRKAGNRVRITAQLIRATEDVHEWSETFDRELDDIFVIQDEIAAAVVDALKLTLLGAARPTVVETDPEVYALYLKGMHFYRVDRNELARAKENLNQAVARDPNYAPAWNVLGMVHCRQADVGDLPPEEGFAKARDAFEKALAIDADSAEAHAGLGWVAMAFDRDLAAAAQHYQRALTLQPGNGEVLGDATMLALSLGRIDIATSLGERALVLDPINLRTHRYLGAAYYRAGRWADAAQCYRRALALSAGYITGQYLLGRVLLAQGEAQAGMEAVQQESHPVYKLTGLALAHHALGQRAESDAALTSLRSDWSETSACQIAAVHAFRGETDEAFEWLNRACDQNDSGVFQIQLNPLLDSLHDDPRWQDLLEQTGLSDERLSAIQFDVVAETSSMPTKAAAAGR